MPHCHIGPLECSSGGGRLLFSGKTKINGTMKVVNRGDKEVTEKWGRRIPSGSKMELERRSSIVLISGKITRSSWVVMNGDGRAIHRERE
jgi:hypothetical protein